MDKTPPLITRLNAMAKSRLTKRGLASLSPISSLARLRSSRSGSMAVYLAVIMVPLLLALGTAVDVGRIIVVKNRTEHALDEATLALGSTSVQSQFDNTCDSSTSDYIPNLVDKYFDANFDPGPNNSMGTRGPITVCQSSDGNTLQASVTVAMPTTFMKLFKYNTLSVTTQSTVQRTLSGLQLAMVLDNTGSMSSTTSDGVTAISALRTSAQNLVDIAWGNPINGQSGHSSNPASSQYLYVGLVPFSQSVNVNPNTLLGGDGNSQLTVGDLVSTTNCSVLGGASTPSYSFSSSNWVAHQDLIHLAQDICVSGLKAKGTGVSSYWTATNIGNWPLTSVTNAGTSSGAYGWTGCILARTGTAANTFGGSSTAQYLDPAPKNASGTAVNFDNEILAGSSYDLSASSTPTNIATNEYWHIMRGNGSAPGRNTSYTTWSSYSSASDPSTYLYWATPIAYKNNSGTTVSAVNPNASCYSTPMTPLTNVYTTLSSSISSMSPNGNTEGDLGVAWGSKLLSGLPPVGGYSNASSTGPYVFSAVPTVDTTGNTIPWIKALVIMTDGLQNNASTSGYSGYGGRLNSTDDPPWKELEAADSTLNGTTPPSGGSPSNCTYDANGPSGVSGEANGYQIECRIYYMCTQLKAQGVVIYTVLFNHDGTANLSDLNATFKQCATDVQHFYIATNGTSLNATFSSIGSELNKLRITR